jgi:hypothetical protein
MQEIVPTIEVSILAVLSGALGHFLDPLESITRYPDSKQVHLFDQNDPYVSNFMAFSNVIDRILQRASKS